MVAAGTVLQHYTREEARVNGVAWRRDFYTMVSACGFLDKDTNVCTNYDQRPEVCVDFEVGSVACGAMRQRAGIIDLAMPGFGSPTPEDHPDLPESA